MRIIAGNLRGMKLKSLEGDNTRPTADRIKESLFNIISQRIPDSKVLDIFGGTGALSIESLSRGAESATLIDNNRQAVGIIKDNLAKARVESKAVVYNGDFLDILKRLNKQYDIIFADPPYKAGLYIKIFEAINELKLLKENGIMIVEHESKNELPETVGELTLFDKRHYGRTSVSFYHLK